LNCKRACDEKELDFIRYHIEGLYKTSRWVMPGDPFSYERIVQKINELNGLANPGVPILFAYTNNTDFVEKFGVRAVVQLVYYRLLLYCSYYDENKDKVEDFLGSSDVADSIRLFIKQEPHKLSKLIDKRYRLIWSLGVIDQIVHALVFDPSIDAVIANYRTCPSKVGFTWFHGGAKDLYYELFEPGGKVIDEDAKAHDWTVSRDLIYMDLICRLDLCDNIDYKETQWYKVYMVSYHSLFSGKIYFSSGDVFRQKQPMIMRSGSKITIDLNSRIAVCRKILTCKRTLGYFDSEEQKLIACGDDVVGRRGKLCEEDIITVGAAMGQIIECSKPSLINEIAFCSHAWIWYKGIPVSIPINWNKHVVMCRFQTDKDVLIQELHSLLIEYTFDKEHFDILHEIFMSLDPPVQYRWSMHRFRTLHLGWESSLCRC
jgi:hypothetical protein